jgi:hypothetical protein
MWNGSEYKPTISFLILPLFAFSNLPSFMHLPSPCHHKNFWWRYTMIQVNKQRKGWGRTVYIGWLEVKSMLGHFISIYGACPSISSSQVSEKKALCKSNWGQSDPSLVSVKQHWYTVVKSWRQVQEMTLEMEISPGVNLSIYICVGITLEHFTILYFKRTEFLINEIGKYQEMTI